MTTVQTVQTVQTVFAEVKLRIEIIQSLPRSFSVFFLVFRAFPKLVVNKIFFNFYLVFFSENIS